MTDTINAAVYQKYINPLSRGHKKLQLCLREREGGCTHHVDHSDPGCLSDAAGQSLWVCVCSASFYSCQRRMNSKHRDCVCPLREHALHKHPSAADFYFLSQSYECFVCEALSCCYLCVCACNSWICLSLANTVQFPSELTGTTSAHLLRDINSD